MSDRDYAILGVLKDYGYFGVTASHISSLIDAPEPSIRRSIQTLRREGFNISFASPTGRYRMA